MAAKSLPDQAYLRQRLSYNPVTGILIWLPRPTSHFSKPWHADRWNRRYAGQSAGLVDGIGYRILTLDDVPYKAHRIIWKMMTGEEPEVTDHVNRVRDDNRWDNLRSGSHVNNMCNAARKSGRQFRGVRKRCQRWTAEIAVDGVCKHIGTFDTPEQAYAAYCAAADQYHGRFASYD